MLRRNRLLELERAELQVRLEMQAKLDAISRRQGPLTLQEELMLLQHRQRPGGQEGFQSTPFSNARQPPRFDGLGWPSYGAPFSMTAAATSSVPGSFFRGLEMPVAYSSLSFLQSQGMAPTNAAPLNAPNAVPSNAFSNDNFRLQSDRTRTAASAAGVGIGAGTAQAAAGLAAFGGPSFLQRGTAAIQGVGQVDEKQDDEYEYDQESEEDDADAASHLDDDEYYKANPRPSRLEEKAQAGAATIPREPFPLKLYRILYEAQKSGQDDIVSFLPNGKVFKIHKPDKFVSNIMPKYFAAGRLNTFMKQLNLYGFHRITEGNDKGAYYHPRFVRGRRFLCSKIRRKRISNNAAAAGSSELTAAKAAKSPSAARHT